MEGHQQVMEALEADPHLERSPAFGQGIEKMYSPHLSSQARWGKGSAVHILVLSRSEAPHCCAE